MAKERGWWKLKLDVEPSQSDLDNIAELIKKGFTQGEVVQDDDSE